jgi:hypothetical protein
MMTLPVPQGIAKTLNFEIVIYGATSAGIIAAQKAHTLGHSVALVDPGRHLGGLSSGGLGFTDIGNKAAIGGLSRRFYERIAEAYGNTGAQWTFEPRVALRVFKDILREEKIPLFQGEVLNRTKGVVKEGSKLVSFRTKSGKVFQAKVFVDASYEGDLMAAAGVSYTVGREGNDRYGETLDGNQPGQAIHHQFDVRVDPYRVEGDPKSGLLFGFDPTGPGKTGEGDRRIQAYNYRLCLTQETANRLPIPKPKGYDPARYELLARYLKAKPDLNLGQLLLINRMPHGKTDMNNNGPFSSDFIGQNYDYAEADETRREKIRKAHKTYIQGFLWFLGHDRRVPEPLRKETLSWGLPKDEYPDTDHWTPQLYVREARRMVSDYVMSEHNCRGQRVATDGVGLAAYTMDSHNVRRYVTADGVVRNEGDVQVGGFPPYPISYKSIVPRKEECTNLLVPVCLSASHIAYGSIRMEPVFMILGESAATAADLALKGDSAVQDVDTAELRHRLLEAGQILEWKKL